MNSFGRVFRISIFGESHGDCIGIVIDGCPPGISISTADFTSDLERRKTGGKATSPRKEDDIPKILSGIFNAKTTGAPLTLLFENNNIRSEDYAKSVEIPRPGHADFTANMKYGGYQDYRGGGHFSGRLTLGIVAAGVIAKMILGEVQINATLVEAGGCINIEEGIEKAIREKDSIGGIVECKVNGLVIGLGEPFFDSAESLISHIVFSIPAVKGIEFGAGFASARMFGSAHNDAILDAGGRTATNHAGGINGGITNGNELIFRVAVKPPSSTPKQQTSLNTHTGQMETFSVKGRHDLCIALRVPVIVEAAAAIALADLELIRRAYLQHG